MRDPASIVMARLVRATTRSTGAGIGGPDKPYGIHRSRKRKTGRWGQRYFLPVMARLVPTAFTHRGNENLPGVDNSIFSPSWPGLSLPCSHIAGTNECDPASIVMARLVRATYRGRVRAGLARTSRAMTGRKYRCPNLPNFRFPDL